MLNERSIHKARSFNWPAINGYAITVLKCWHGGGRSAFATVSPWGLVRNHGSGRSLYRRGFRTPLQAFEFSLVDGTIYVKHLCGKTHRFYTQLSSRAIRIALTSHTFISLRSARLHDGSRTWLCTPVLVIRRRSSR